MAKLIYFTAVMSLDGYIEDQEGNIDFALPTEEVLRFVYDFLRPVGTYLFGRRLYETMAVWETDPSLAETGPHMQDYAQIWKATDKIVYSKSLETAYTTRTRIERDFVPEAVRQMKASAAQTMLVGGAELAAQAFKAGLVDECHMVLAPVVLGGGKHGLPRDTRLNLELLDERRFDNGMVYLGYRTKL